MRPGPVRTAVVMVALVAGLVSCGKKGNPLPPLRPVPGRITDLTAVRTAGQVELRFTVPIANLDATQPVAIDRVDIFGMRATAGQPPLTAGPLSSDRSNLLESLPVHRPAGPDAGGPGATTSTLVPQPGEKAVFVHRTDEAERAGATGMYYVAVPVAGTGRGRAGPATAVVSVPFAPLPLAPSGLAVSHDETSVRVTWASGPPGEAFRVVRLAAVEDASGRQVLTPAAITAAEFTAPVEFGREWCVAVQTLVVAGAVSAEGPVSEPVCITPVDRYPPPVPGGVRVVQEGAVVTVIWDGVPAADLAGYVVLRSLAGDATMTPLFRVPLTETTYRDTTVVAGETYSYAVYSVDSSPDANVSGLSLRESIAVR